MSVCQKDIERLKLKSLKEGEGEGGEEDHNLFLDSATASSSPCAVKIVALQPF